METYSDKPLESELAYSRLIKLMENPKWLVLHLQCRRCAIALQKPDLSIEQIGSIQRRLMALTVKKTALE
jgi:hypothetical protein